MQRSLVKEFKASNSSIYHSTVLGTHSFLGSRQPLSPRSDTQQLTSRIAHLPGDQRTDLTAHPQMIIVFQAIQISRLTNEIETLRVKMREREDVVINAGSYQVQIRELAERCNRIQNEKFSYMEELSRTKQMSQVIYNQLTSLKSRYQEVDFSAVEKYKLEKARNQQLSLEIEKWKSRYSSLDRSKGQNAEASRRTLQWQRESIMHTSTKDLLTKFEGEREQLMGRLRERKEQIDEKQLQLKKLNNCYEQLQIRIQEQEHSIEEYQEKVAMLSQENYRLSQLNRVKTEQIKNLKMANEHDVSMRLSQITCLDETKHKLNSKLRDIEDNNERLRTSLQESQRQIIQLKKRASQAERLEFQVSQTRRDIQSKLKTMERKDKRIMGLQEQIKKYKQTEQQLAAVKRLSKQLANRIQTLQEKISQKIEELNRIRSSFERVCEEHQNQVNRLNDKMKEYEKLYTILENSCKQNMKSENLIQQKSNQLQLHKREAMLQLKQKDYTIASLQNQLKQIQARYQTFDEQHTTVIYQLQQQIQKERQTFQSKVKESQYKKQETNLLIREKQSLIREIQTMNRQNSQLRRLLSGVVSLQDELSFKQTQISTELRSFQSRLNRIEQLLSNLRNNLVQRHNATLENQQRLKITQLKYQQLHQWFFRLAQSMNKSAQFTPSPKKRMNESPIRPFMSPQRSKDQKSSYAMGTSIYGFRGNGENINSANSSLESVPAQWLLKYVLLCAEVQSLRKKVGDKQAKVQSMRNSIASKHSSSSTFVNVLGSSTSSHSGFYTSRQNSLNRKGNVYY